MLNTIKAVDVDHLVLQFDGAARPNPGRTASAAILYDRDGNTVHHACEGLDYATNNVAEWSALRLGLEHAARLGARTVDCYGDSALVIAQAFENGLTQASHLQPIAREIKVLSGRFERIRGKHIMREQNAAADALANRFLEGCYIPLTDNDASLAPLAFALTLRLEPNKLQTLADRTALKKQLNRALQLHLSGSNVTLKRTGTDPFYGEQYTVISFVIEIPLLNAAKGLSTRAVVVRETTAALMRAAHDAADNPTKIILARISG